MRSNDTRSRVAPSEEEAPPDEAERTNPSRLVALSSAGTILCSCCRCDCSWRGAHSTGAPGSTPGVSRISATRAVLTAFSSASRTHLRSSSYVLQRNTLPCIWKKWRVKEEADRVKSEALDWGREGGGGELEITDR